MKETIFKKKEEAVWKSSKMGAIWENRDSERLNTLWGQQGSTFSRGPVADLTGGKESQYAKSAKDSGKTKPFAPSTLGNPTEESGG